jgi:hypothetical protein
MRRWCAKDVSEKLAVSLKDRNRSKRPVKCKKWRHAGTYDVGLAHDGEREGLFHQRRRRVGRRRHRCGGVCVVVLYAVSLLVSAVRRRCARPGLGSSAEVAALKVRKVRSAQYLYRVYTRGFSTILPSCTLLLHRTCVASIRICSRFLHISRFAHFVHIQLY